jgi:hypothetical protein
MKNHAIQFEREIIASEVIVNYPPPDMLFACDCATLRFYNNRRSLKNQRPAAVKIQFSANRYNLLQNRFGNQLTVK